MSSRTGPFGHAKAMFAAIAAAYALPYLDQQKALGNIGSYRSRGKGRGTPSRRYGNPEGRYMPREGSQECMRRRIGGWARSPFTKKAAITLAAA